MNNIDYASLYGVQPGESDFSGAIKRSMKQIKENGIHQLNVFVKLLYKYKNL